MVQVTLVGRQTTPVSNFSSANKEAEGNAISAMPVLRCASTPHANFALQANKDNNGAIPTIRRSHSLRNRSVSNQGKGPVVIEEPCSDEVFHKNEVLQNSTAPTFEQKERLRLSANVHLIRQMADLADRTEKVFHRLRTETEQVANRVENLKARAANLQTTVDRRPNPRTMQIASAGSIQRAESVIDHFKSQQPVNSVVFTPATRPDGLRQLYIAAGRAGKPSPPTETCATQTERSSLRKYSYRQATCGEAERKKPTSPAASVFDLPDLPTPEQKCRAMARQCKATVVAVDTSGSSLKRMSGVPPPVPRRRPRTQRRTTIASVHSTCTSMDPPFRSRSPVKLRQGSGVAIVNVQSDTGSEETPGEPDSPTIAVECPYDVLPFEKRKRGIMSASGLFGSLRRSKKDSSEKIYSTLKQHPVSFRHNTDSDSCSGTEESQGGFKRFVRRSMSLKLRKNTDSIYENLPFRKKSEERKGFSGPNTSPQKKLSLPITTSSQVLQLATVMRHQNNVPRPQPPPVPSRMSKDSGYESVHLQDRKQDRRPSFAASLASLDLNESRNEVEGSYRRGYQLDFPEENTVHHYQVSSAVPRGEITQRRAAERVTSESDQSTTSAVSPYQTGGGQTLVDSAGEDSEYSCDQEGYFTTMHTECGLIAEKCRIEALTVGNRNRLGGGKKKGRSFSTHSSCSTVAAEPICEEDEEFAQIKTEKRPESSGDSGAEDLQSPLSDQKDLQSPSSSSDQASVVDYNKLVDVKPQVAYPPLCEVSISESESGSPMLQRAGPFRSSAPIAKTTKRPRILAVPPPEATIRHCAAPPKSPKDYSAVPKEIDDWLLRKFQRELVMKNDDSERNAKEMYCSRSLPRNGKINLSLYATNMLFDKSCKEMDSNLNTLPAKKLVRFCD